MSRHVAIVTDSTAYLPPLTMERHGITAVPLTVVLGDRALEEGTEISTRSLAQALQKRRPVTTSRPSPQLFAETYRKVAESGATGIVSLHLSAELSGTYDAAVVAAREAPVPVRVVDTGMVAMALGFCALAAAETAEAGGTVDEAVTAAEKRAAGTSAYFYVDTLDYLRRGGRISWRRCGRRRRRSPALRNSRRTGRAVHRSTSRSITSPRPSGRRRSRTGCGRGCQGWRICM
jgi:DegV family protein with EDD domain